MNLQDRSPASPLRPPPARRRTGQPPPLRGFSLGEFMTPRPLRPRLIRAAWLALALGAFAASRADAQTPSNTWIATTDGVWSNGPNWDTGTAPVPGATTTILQFNASGATA